MEYRDTHFVFVSRRMPCAGDTKFQDTHFGHRDRIAPDRDEDPHIWEVTGKPLPWEDREAPVSTLSLPTKGSVVRTCPVCWMQVGQYPPMAFPEALPPPVTPMAPPDLP